MTQLSVDYTGLVRGLQRPLVPADLGAALLDAVAERYKDQIRDCSLLQFVQSGATYLFDLASAVGAEQEEPLWVAPTRHPRRVRAALKDIPLPAKTIGDPLRDPFAEARLDPEVVGWES